MFFVLFNVLYFCTGKNILSDFWIWKFMIPRNILCNGTNKSSRLPDTIIDYREINLHSVLVVTTTVLIDVSENCARFRWLPGVSRSKELLNETDLIVPWRETAETGESNQPSTNFLQWLFFFSTWLNFSAFHWLIFLFLSYFYPVDLILPQTLLISTTVA